MQQPLIDYIDLVKHRPFSWGAHDCLTFVVGAVEAQTGENADYLNDLNYFSHRGARRELRKFLDMHGVVKLEDFLDQEFEVTDKPSFGNIARLNGFTYGICCGNGSAWFVDHKGLVTKDLKARKRFWKVA